MKNIYSLRPVNRTAGLVVNQNGCGDGEPTLEQKRDILVKKFADISQKTSQMPKKSKERIMLVKQQHEIQASLSELNAKLKTKGKRPDLASFVMGILKEEMTRFQYERLLERAQERYEKSIEQQDL